MFVIELGRASTELFCTVVFFWRFFSFFVVWLPIAVRSSASLLGFIDGSVFVASIVRCRQPINGQSGFTGFYRVLPGFTGFYWVFMGFTGFLWVDTEFYRVLLGFTGFCRVVQGCTGFYRVLPGSIRLLACRLCSERCVIRGLTRCVVAKRRRRKENRASFAYQLLVVT